MEIICLELQQTNTTKLFYIAVLKEIDNEELKKLKKMCKDAK